jgi:hypothetical protein
MQFYTPEDMEGKETVEFMMSVQSAEQLMLEIASCLRYYEDCLDTGVIGKLTPNILLRCKIDDKLVQSQFDKLSIRPGIATNVLGLLFFAKDGKDNPVDVQNYKCKTPFNDNN